MKRRGLWVIPVILVVGCKRPDAAAGPHPRETVERPASVSHSDPPPTSDPGEAAVNERTRPSQRPEPKVYAKPKSVGPPTAVAVEGRPGYVTSPYNAKIIDVRDIPSGTLVADPTFPSEEKKYFRTP